MSETLSLTAHEQSMLAGEQGEGCSLAMRLVTRLATAMGATKLLPISGAHIDSCLYHGQSGIDFVDRLVERAAAVVVPTTLNVSSLDLLHPELFRGDDETKRSAKALMDGYVALGCEPTWTCAPYQGEQRPAFGDHVAWAESNAIVFANSVLGARTHRYGDFIDIAAAITGRVPAAGLHLNEQRFARRVFDVSGLPAGLLDTDAAYACIGFVVGKRTGSEVPAIVGLPADATEDRLKALGAAAASSGSLALFHAVGRTPEAPSLEAACGGSPPSERTTINAAALRAARDQLSASAADGAALATVSLGTPHYSIDEVARLHSVLGGRRVHNSVSLYVSTSRAVLHEAMLRGLADELEQSGVTFVTDTCTYITPIVQDTNGLAMTDSAKWAYYAPGNIGVRAIFGTLHECVSSAIAGRVVRDGALWADQDG